MNDSSRASDQWSDYYKITGDRPPRATLLYALDCFEPELSSIKQPFAVDVGCGSGRDTVELLRRGWRVLAIDPEAAALDSLGPLADLQNPQFEYQPRAVQDLKWPTAVDLVNASFSLPLCPPQQFPNMWRRMLESLRPGGRFSGQLYGERDGWAGDPTLTHHSRAELEHLLAELEMEYFKEEEQDSITPRGKPKHWHIYHVVARKLTGMPT